MKKLDASWKVIIIIAIILVVQIVGTIFVVGNTKGEQYAMTTVVVELDQENDEVICMDFNGNEWVFTEIEDWMVGDIATMVMNDKGTDIIYDDEIVSVRYDGWIDGPWGFDGETNITEFSWEK